MATLNLDKRVYYKRRCPKLSDFVVGYASFSKLDCSAPTTLTPEDFVVRRNTIDQLFQERSMHRTPVLCRLFMEVVEYDKKSCIAVPATCEYGADSKFMFITEVNSFQQVTSAALQACLTFAIQSWISPHWNKVGSKLIQGSQFLDDMGRLSAIDWELNAQADELVLSVAVSQTHTRPTEVDDFLQDPKSLERLLVNNETVFCGPSDTCACYVLPSEKEARVCSVSPVVPSTCPFTTNDQLYQNWKLAYGYTCVDGQGSRRSANLIANVQFRPCGQLFSYPLACIREHRYFYNDRCADDKRMIHQFLNDVRENASGMWSSHLDFTAESSQRPFCSLVQSHVHDETAAAFMGPAILKQRVPIQAPKSLPTVAQRNLHPVPQSIQTTVLRPSHVPVPVQQSICTTHSTQPSHVSTLEKPKPVVPRFMSKNERIKLTFARRAATSMKAATEKSGSHVPLGVFGSSSAATATCPAPPKPVSISFLSQKRRDNHFAPKGLVSSVPQRRKDDSAVGGKALAMKGKSSSSGAAKKSTAAKPTAKSTTEEDIEKVDSLLQAGMLSKANISQLCTWLRNKGKKIGRQDKKVDLIGRVIALSQDCTQRKAGRDIFDREP